METAEKKFNWLFDDMNQDLLIHLSCQLNAHYGRFCNNDFYKPVAGRFKEKFDKWSTYFKKVQAGDIYFASEEEINAEVKRLTEAVAFAEQDGLTGDEADYLTGPQWADCDGDGGEKTYKVMQPTNEKINWVGEFTINEGLHGNAQSLSGIFSRLSFNI